MRSFNACVVLSAVALLCSVSTVAGTTGIIKVSGTEFADQNCNKFVFSGYNTWQILETAGGACCGGRASVQSQLDAAVANNLTVIRMFGYGTGYNYQLQTGATTFNNSALQDFDYVLQQVSQRGLKVTISLASNWVYSPGSSGTKCWYTNLTNTAATCDDFFTDSNAITLYKNWVKAIAGRTNSLTNVSYASDPTIFSWNLINEPRCDSSATCTSSDIQSWIASVAPYVKSQVKQLVTVGEDGFMQASNCLATKINPVTNDVSGGSWCLATGQNFVANHAVNGIDYAAIHLWPDNWARSDNTFGQNWLYAHNNLSQTVLQKPLVVEEFGKAYGGNTIATGQGATETDQANYYKLVYSIVENSIDGSGAIQGIGFWRWASAQSDTSNLASFDNAATISTTGQTFSQVVLPFSQRVVALQTQKVSGCGTSSAPTTATTGRKLLQASSPTPSASSVDASIPSSLCNAYPTQPSSVG